MTSRHGTTGLAFSVSFFFNNSFYCVFPVNCSWREQHCPGPLLLTASPSCSSPKVLLREREGPPSGCRESRLDIIHTPAPLPHFHIVPVVPLVYSSQSKTLRTPESLVLPLLLHCLNLTPKLLNCPVMGPAFLPPLYSALHKAAVWVFLNGSHSSHLQAPKSLRTCFLASEVNFLAWH